MCFVWYSYCLWEQATLIVKPLAYKWLYAEGCANIIIWINELFSEQQNWWAWLLNDQCLVDGFCAKDWSHDSVLLLAGALIGSLLSGHLPEGFFWGFNCSVRVPSQWLLCWNVSWTSKRCTQIRSAQLYKPWLFFNFFLFYSPLPAPPPPKSPDNSVSLAYQANLG